MKKTVSTEVHTQQKCLCKDIFRHRKKSKLTNLNYQKREKKVTPEMWIYIKEMNKKKWLAVYFFFYI